MSVWALFTKNDELYALRDTWDEIVAARRSGELYLDGAATCGHPSGPPYVNARLPFKVQAITPARAAMLLEEEGTPVLDREP